MKKNTALRFYLFLPMLALPFLTVAFVCMGGGDTGKAQFTSVQGGLNMQLPQAQAGIDSGKDKLGLYMVADAESVKREELIRMDPYRKDSPPKALLKDADPPHAYHHAATESIDEKIQQLQRQLSGDVKRSVLNKEGSQGTVPTAVPVENKVTTQPDPEMEALNGTLEKILDIQHPERVSHKSSQDKTIVYVVSNALVSDDSFFGSRDTAKKTATFYQDISMNKNEGNAIPAVIANEQLVRPGSVVKLRLLSSITVNGVVVPAGSFVYGIAALEKERLMIRISSIRSENSLLPVALCVYDMDGLEGIYAPGSAAGEAIKESADQSIGSLGLTSLDASLKAQAAAAGINAAKNLLRKKVKESSVTLKAGYKILLNNEARQNP